MTEEEGYCYKESKIFTDYAILNFKMKKLVEHKTLEKQQGRPSYKQELQNLCPILFQFDPSLENITDQIVSTYFLNA